jgi:hypothetical protein
MEIPEVMDPHVVAFIVLFIAIIVAAGWTAVRCYGRSPYEPAPDGFLVRRHAVQDQEQRDQVSV